MLAKYDKIGINYNSTRKADPYLVERMLHHLLPQSDGIYLDIGCGTGNYTFALWQKGVNFIGVDPSIAMLDKAISLYADIEWKQGVVEKLPVENESVNGVLASLTIHHWSNLTNAISEIKRVLKPNGRLVIFTSLPEQTAGYWLSHYFPKMIQASAEQMPSFNSIEKALKKAGFENIEKEPYFVKPDLMDLFLYAGKHDPSLYFREDVRAGISSFSSLANAQEVEVGLHQLKDDINSGAINNVMKKFENKIGDYLFITAVKKPD